jgi:hypothetical protein
MFLIWFGLWFRYGFGFGFDWVLIWFGNGAPFSRFPMGWLQRCVTSTTTPCNLHGTSMEPSWNLHQSEYMIKPTNVDRGNTFKTHMETA